MLIAIYIIFSIVERVNEYTAILNIATNLILIFAIHVVKYPNTAKNTAFERVVNKYIAKLYTNIVKNTEEKNSIIKNHVERAYKNISRNSLRILFNSTVFCAIINTTFARKEINDHAKYGINSVFAFF